MPRPAHFLPSSLAHRASAPVENVPGLRVQALRASGAGPFCPGILRARSGGWRRDARVGLDLGRVNVEIAPPHQPSLLPEITDPLEEVLEEVDAGCGSGWSGRAVPHRACSLRPYCKTQSGHLKRARSGRSAFADRPRISSVCLGPRQDCSWSPSPRWRRGAWSPCSATLHTTHLARSMHRRERDTALEPRLKPVGTEPGYCWCLGLDTGEDVFIRTEEIVSTGA
jgi:hypothetical protein